MNESRWNEHVSSDLADRLIDKREKLAYFVVTASVAVTVFTLNNMNDANGIVRGQGLGPWLLSGCILLLVSAGLSLSTVLVRHDQYSRWLTIKDTGDPEGAIDRAMTHWENYIRRVRVLMVGTFVIGMGLIVGTFSAAL